MLDLGRLPIPTTKPTSSAKLRSGENRLDAACPRTIGLQYNFTGIAVLVNNRPCRTLIDMTASHYFVHADIVDIRRMKPAQQEAQLATCPQTVLIAGEITVTIETRDIKTMTNAFVLCDLSEEVILGVPCLS
ncbi:hypothetical protein PR048_020099 [Dryococelus australis]|uniref:Uncharacterized protein n=1 Tax=Dryococelus australis TaxID=614101 RepID=A0ABQ9H5D8_9NEOP|nr:hypothetical protein PR048_020099 [Dryococelus australis]